MARRKGIPDALTREARMATLRTAAELAKEHRWTAGDVGRKLESFLDELPLDLLDRHQLKEQDFTPDRKTLKAALAQARETNDGLTMALYLWLNSHCEERLRDNITKEETKGQEQFASGLKTALGHDPDLNLSKAKELAGTYRLYRPFHLDPEEYVMIGIMKIGEDGDFECSTRFDFVEGRRKRSTPSSGKIVPHGTRATAILAVDHSIGSSLIIYFDRIDRGNNDAGANVTFSLSGILVAGVGQERASSWPCFAEPTTSDAKPLPHMSWADLRQQDEGIFNDLRRGFVAWRPSTDKAGG